MFLLYLHINLVIKESNSNCLLNLISCLVGCILTSIIVGSTLILITTIGYLISGL